MLITSLTTGAAFVMNLSSTVPAIQVGVLYIEIVSARAHVCGIDLQIFGGFTAFMVWHCFSATVCTIQ